MTEKRESSYCIAQMMVSHYVSSQCKTEQHLINVSNCALKAAWSLVAASSADHYVAVMRILVLDIWLLWQTVSMRML